MGYYGQREIPRKDEGGREAEQFNHCKFNKALTQSQH